MATKGFISLEKINPELQKIWHEVPQYAPTTMWFKRPPFYMVSGAVKGVVGEQTGSSYDDRSKES